MLPPRVCSACWIYGAKATQEFRSETQIEKGHGRIERRTLTASRELKGYAARTGAEQVFKLEREFKQMNTGKITPEVGDGITSLTAQAVGAKRLLEITRSHWGIESGLHYRRDVTLHEDRCRVRRGQVAHALAVINNLVLGLFARLGYARAPDARRHFAAHPDEAVNLVLRC